MSEQSCPKCAELAAAIDGVTLTGDRVAAQCVELQGAIGALLSLSEKMFGYLSAAVKRGEVTFRPPLVRFEQFKAVRRARAAAEPEIAVAVLSARDAAKDAQCAELAAAIAELQTLYRENEKCMVEDGHSKRVDDTDYAAIGKEALDRHDAAKDAEIQRLRGALETIANSSHCESHPGESDYGMGVADGHRCAANMAKAALEVQP